MMLRTFSARTGSVFRHKPRLLGRRGYRLAIGEPSEVPIDDLTANVAYAVTERSMRELRDVVNSAELL